MTLFEVSKLCTPLYWSKNIPHSIKSYLLVLLHSGIQLLGEVIGHIGHARLLLIATTQAALVFTCLLIVLLFGIFAVSLAHLAILKTFYVRYLSNTMSQFYYFYIFYNCRTNHTSQSFTLKRHTSVPRNIKLTSLELLQKISRPAIHSFSKNIKRIDAQDIQAKQYIMKLVCPLQLHTFGQSPRGSADKFSMQFKSKNNCKVQLISH